MNDGQIAYKFVSWETPSLDALKDTFPYRMKEKLLRGEKLTKEERYNLFVALYNQDRYGIKLMGWYFSFYEYLRRIWVKQKYYGIQEYYAIDKTSVRTHLGHDVIEMIYPDDKEH